MPSKTNYALKDHSFIPFEKESRTERVQRLRDYLGFSQNFNYKGKTKVKIRQQTTKKAIFNNAVGALDGFLEEHPDVTLTTDQYNAARKHLVDSQLASLEPNFTLPNFPPDNRSFFQHVADTLSARPT